MQESLKLIKQTLILCLSLAGIVAALLASVSLSNHVRAVLFSRVSSYEAICREKSPGLWHSTVGFHRVSYRVSFQDQLVVETTYSAKRIKGCTVADAKNWNCEEAGAHPTEAFHDGEMRSWCDSGGACFLPLTPTQYVFNRLLHPADWGLEKLSAEMCQNYSGLFMVLRL